VEESRHVIPVPAHAPEWTDHDVSDPGVTLLELVALLGEDLLYRQRRDYFQGRRLHPGDVAAEQCYLRRKRWLLWTVPGVACAALLLVVALARRRAKAQPTTEAQEED